MYRPVRVGWVVHSEDREAMRLAMRMSFCLVGGIYNPLILVDQPEAEALVRLFRLDVLEVVGSHPAAKAFAAQFQHLGQLGQGPLFKTSARGVFSTCQLLDVANGVRVWSEWSNWNDCTGEESGIKLIHWAADDALADVHLAEYGGYPDQGVVGRDYAGQVSRWMASKQPPTIRIGSGTPLPTALTSAYNPTLFFAEHGVQWRYPADRGWFFPGIYLGDGSRVVDIVNFWNIRAANMPIRFVDHTRLDRYAGLAVAMTQRMRQTLNGLPDSRRNPAIWATDEALAASLADQVAPGGGINLCPVDTALWNGGAIQVPTMYLDERSALGVEARSRVTFSLPDRPYSHDDDSGQYLIASVRIDTSATALDRNETFVLPFLPECNAAFAGALGLWPGHLRLEPGRLGLVVQANATDQTVSALPAWELAVELFKAAGLTATLSNGGLIAQQLVKQVGGYEGGRVFKIPGVRRLLRTYGANESFTKQAAVKLIGERDPISSASFADHHSLFIEPRDITTDLNPGMAFAYLVEKSLVRAGWDLRCRRCQLQEWIALDQLRQQHVCGYCGEGYDATRQFVESPMTFRRSGLLGIQRDAQGAVPVALVLQQLACNLRGGAQTSLFLPSIELTDATGTGFKCETDLFAILMRGYPKKPAVVIGECKDREGRIDAEDIAKLGALSSRLEATGLEVFILLAKLGPFSDAEIALAKSLNGPWQHRVILLTDKELEPFDLYARHEDEQGGRLFGGNIQNLALNSERIHPGLENPESVEALG